MKLFKYDASYVRKEYESERAWMIYDNWNSVNGCSNIIHLRSTQSQVWFDIEFAYLFPYSNIAILQLVCLWSLWWLELHQKKFSSFLDVSCMLRLLLANWLQHMSKQAFCISFQINYLFNKWNFCLHLSLIFLF